MQARKRRWADRGDMPPEDFVRRGRTHAVNARSDPKTSRRKRSREQRAKAQAARPAPEPKREELRKELTEMHKITEDTHHSADLSVQINFKRKYPKNFS